MEPPLLPLCFSAMWLWRRRRWRASQRPAPSRQPLDLTAPCPSRRCRRFRLRLRLTSHGWRTRRCLSTGSRRLTPRSSLIRLQHLCRKTTATNIRGSSRSTLTCSRSMATGNSITRQTAARVVQARTTSMLTTLMCRVGTTSVCRSTGKWLVMTCPYITMWAILSTTIRRSSRHLTTISTRIRWVRIAATSLFLRTGRTVAACLSTSTVLAAPSWYG